MTTSREVLEAAQARIDARISNPRCPFCDTNEWITLPTAALRSVAWPGPDATGPDATGNATGDVAGDGGAGGGQGTSASAPSVSRPSVDIGAGAGDLAETPLLVVGFACARCRFVRFHQFTP
ncbi:MAG: hypothetical protein ACRDY1_16035 [Acidimicrobiales bacterium]